MNELRPLRSSGVAERALAEALALGPALLLRAREEGASQVAASVVQGPAVVLGAAQRAGRVIDMEACAQAGTRVFRRATTGTAAFVGGASIVWTLALPDVSALVADATARSLVNRNVRGFLRGFRGAGALAHYFGREWIALRHRPGALLGFEVASDGAVLIEVFAGYTDPIAVPGAIATPSEREVDRWLGKAPAALRELVPEGRSPGDIAHAVLEGVALHAGVRLEGASLDRGALACAAEELSSPMDPVPEGLALGAPRRVPIGWIEAAASPPESGAPRRVWLGGDVLAPTWVLTEVARAAAAGDVESPAARQAAIEGAALDHLREVAKGALLGV